MRLPKVFLLNWRALLCALWLTCLAPSVFADEWANKKKYVVDTSPTGADIGSDVAQLPVLLRLHSGNFTFTEAKPDGSDLRFFAADAKTPLSYHIENFDAVNELANVWISLPKLTANSKTDAVVMVWGNPKALSGASAKATYDPSYVLVQHFTQGFKDATGNANHPQVTGIQALPSGPIGAAGSFDGASKMAIEGSASFKLEPNSAFTLAAWIKPNAVDGGAVMRLGDTNKKLAVEMVGGFLQVTSGKDLVRSSLAITPSVWQHIVVVLEASKATLYINGLAAGSGALTLTETNGNALIGEGFRGDMDELTVANSARSADYIKALYASQEADSMLLAVSDEAPADSGDSVMGILLGAVTLDGWIVIALLGVMAVLSFYVMISKAFILSSNAKANKIFLDAFESNWHALLSPGSSEASQMAANKALLKSSIYRLYMVGVYEVKQRFDAQMANQQKFYLSDAMLNSVRAALDAAMMREMQKLNSGIVALTISIAGGPFLGLLGTVVGVMITFAAIAAAGDVNVNAIAPGIAAALVATVAGLAVAIPALFGYNWLASQIKNASSDGAVFLDEFITKSAEMHSV